MLFILSCCALSRRDIPALSRTGNILVIQYLVSLESIPEESTRVWRRNEWLGTRWLCISAKLTARNGLVAIVFVVIEFSPQLSSSARSLNLLESCIVYYTTLHLHFQNCITNIKSWQRFQQPKFGIH